MRSIAASLLLLLLVAAAAFGQATTGNLNGRVIAQGEPVPGVTVTIASRSLQGTRTFLTAPDGTYLFPSLPPGVYTVTFEMTGLQTAVKSAELHLSETTRVDIELRPLLTETISVTPAGNSVLETPQVAMNIDARTLEYLPVGRGILDAVRIAPGVQPTGPNNQLMINGGYSYDNLYLVNGVTVNEPTRGQPHNLFIEDAIQELTVVTAAVSAEYGRFTGGVVNVLTRSGGNERSGSARDTLSSDDWAARTPFVNEPKHLDKINNDYQATLGGRILRDRLWFFLAGRYAERTKAAATIGTFIPYADANHEARYEAKLTANLSQQHTLVGSYMNIHSATLNTSVGAGELDVLENRKQPNSIGSLHYTGIFSQSFVAEAQFHRKFFAFEATNPTERDRVSGTVVFDNNLSGQFNSPVFCYTCGNNQRNNRDVQLKGSWFVAPPHAGNHNLVFGYDDYHENAIDNAHQSPSDFTILSDVLIVGQQGFLHAVPFETELELDAVRTPAGASDYATRSYFVNDRIDFGAHLSANVGLRYDSTRGVDEFGFTQAKDAGLAPRLGVIYDLAGNGRDRVSASYSVYSSRAQERIGATSSGLYGQTTIWLYSGPEINGDPASLIPTREVVRRIFQWFDASGGVNNEDDLELRTAAGEYEIPNKLKTPGMDEIAIGYGHQFGQRAFVRADFVKRAWHDFYTLAVDRSSGKKIDSAGAVQDRVSIRTDDGTLQRDYQGVVLQAGAGWRRITAGGNYTWSKLRGNIEQESAGAGSVAAQPAGAYYPEFTSFAQYQPEGYLAGDVRHRANAWLGYELPTAIGRFNLSLLQQYHSALSYNAAGLINLRNVVPNPGYVTPPTARTYFFAPRGSLRLDSVTSTGLGINYARRFGAYEWFAEADVRNVFGEQAIENPGGINAVVRTSNSDRNLAQFDPNKTAPVECPQNVATSSTQCRGIANYQLSPTFGKVTSAGAYQEPRTYGFSLGLRF